MACMSPHSLHLPSNFCLVGTLLFRKLYFDGAKAWSYACSMEEPVFCSISVHFCFSWTIDVHHVSQWISLHFAFSQPKGMSCSVRAKLKLCEKEISSFLDSWSMSVMMNFVNSSLLWSHIKKKGDDTQWGRQHMKNKVGYCKKDT